MFCVWQDRKEKNKSLRGEMRGKEEEGDQDDQGLKIYNGWLD